MNKWSRTDYLFYISEFSKIFYFGEPPYQIEKYANFYQDTKLCEHLSLRNESVIGGEMLQSASAHIRYNFQIAPEGDGRLDFDVVAPLDKTIAEKSSVQARACFQDFSAAAEINVDKPVRIFFSEKSGIKIP